MNVQTNKPNHVEAACRAILLRFAELRVQPGRNANPAAFFVVASRYRGGCFSAALQQLVDDADIEISANGFYRLTYKGYQAARALIA